MTYRLDILYVKLYNVYYGKNLRYGLKDLLTTVVIPQQKQQGKYYDDDVCNRIRTRIDDNGYRVIDTIGISGYERLRK